MPTSTPTPSPTSTPTSTPTPTPTSTPIVETLYYPIYNPTPTPTSTPIPTETPTPTPTPTIMESEPEPTAITTVQEESFRATDDEVEASTEGATTVINVLSNDDVVDGIRIRLIDVTEGEIATFENDTAIGGTSLNPTDRLVVVGEGVWEVADTQIIFTAEDGFEGTPTPIHYYLEDRNSNRSNIATVKIVSNCVCKPYEAKTEKSVPSLNIFGLLIFMLTMSLYYRDNLKFPSK
jgi:hypothetical protein